MFECDWCFTWYPRIVVVPVLVEFLRVEVWRELTTIARSRRMRVVMTGVVRWSLARVRQMINAWRSSGVGGRGGGWDDTERTVKPWKKIRLPNWIIVSCFIMWSWFMSPLSSLNCYNLHMLVSVSSELVEMKHHYLIKSHRMGSLLHQLLLERYFYQTWNLWNCGRLKPQ